MQTFLIKVYFQKHIKNSTSYTFSRNTNIFYVTKHINSNASYTNQHKRVSSPHHTNKPYVLLSILVLFNMLLFISLPLFGLLKKENNYLDYWTNQDHDENKDLFDYLSEITYIFPSKINRKIAHINYFINWHKYLRKIANVNAMEMTLGIWYFLLFCKHNFIFINYTFKPYCIYSQPTLFCLFLMEHFEMSFILLCLRFWMYVWFGADSGVPAAIHHTVIRSRSWVHL